MMQYGVKCFLLVFLLLLAQLSWAAERKKQVDLYLHDFVSQAFQLSYPTIYKAIEVSLMGVPQEVLDKVNNADFPAIFVEMPHFGGGRWANSNGIFVEPHDPPTFTKGVWIIKLSTELEDAKDVDAVQGVVLHELAHFVLDHHEGVFNQQHEKDANHLVRKWGFEEKFLKAREKFGSHQAKK